MGYFAIALFIFNWESFFFLFVDDGGALERIQYFSDNTNLQSLLWLPLLSSVAYTLLYPWVSVVFLYLCQKPTDLVNALQANSEHKMLEEKNRLEKLRAESQAISEQTLIEQAKRDQQVQELTDEDLKESVRSDIQAIRKRGSNGASSGFRVDDPEKLLAFAESYRTRARNGPTSEKAGWLNRADDTLSRCWPVDRPRLSRVRGYCHLYPPRCRW